MKELSAHYSTVYKQGQKLSISNNVDCLSHLRLIRALEEAQHGQDEFAEHQRHRKLVQGQSQNMISSDVIWKFLFQGIWKPNMVPCRSKANHWWSLCQLTCVGNTKIKYRYSLENKSLQMNYENAGQVDELADVKYQTIILHHIYKIPSFNVASPGHYFFGMLLEAKLYIHHLLLTWKSNFISFM